MDLNADEDSDVVSSLGHTSAKASKASHRRVWSVGVGGAVELNKLKKEQEVKILHSELEKQSRALEESQEETQLAARIGQSLLLQKQQLDYEMEDKVSALTQRCGDATSQVQELDAKYKSATVQCRQLDQLRVQHELQIEDLTDKSALKTLKDELVHARAKTIEASAQNTHLMTEVEELKKRVVDLKQVNGKLNADLGKVNLHLGELGDSNRELELQVSELTERLQSAVVDADKFVALQAEHGTTVKAWKEAV
ncbi:hypothetical protein, variant [Aphanomyces astaci]|uniref:Myosin tail domain-containing protein n=1 Tax=Aphanomyces astaci TaxID=112090 RepID=W4G7A6_APHAT|nr:hypothetical protein, variant [Aphanomyces astaci]ETV74838.1 hypothetical protein, variant [Aphanomyces astaci]|eukprot:XP_009835925.1 hypothetical protein, variant [Aphanomyces astaci]